MHDYCGSSFYEMFYTNFESWRTTSQVLDITGRVCHSLPTALHQYSLQNGTTQAKDRYGCAILNNFQNFKLGEL